jgi:LPS sulfotransferase NodH
VTRTVPFIVLATQRTGSSWVQEMLNSHPAMRVYTELFVADASGYPMWEPSEIEFANSYLEARAGFPRFVTRPYWGVRYLHSLFDQRDVRAVGLKYMYDQVRRSPEVLPYVAARQVKVVHLIRANMLDTVVSAKLARTTGLYHLAGDDRPPVPWWPSQRVNAKVRLEVPELLSDLRRLSRERERIRTWLRLTRTPTLEVEYEALAQDAKAFGPVLEFLGCPGSEAALLSSGLQKVRTNAQAEAVENLTEVQEALAATPYGVFLKP